MMTHFRDTVWRTPSAPCCSGCSLDVPSPLLSDGDVASRTRQFLHALHSCSSTLSSSLTYRHGLVMWIRGKKGSKSIFCHSSSNTVVMSLLLLLLCRQYRTHGDLYGRERTNRAPLLLLCIDSQSSASYDDYGDESKPNNTVTSRCPAGVDQEKAAFLF